MKAQGEVNLAENIYEWEPGQNNITGTHMLKLTRESAMGSSFTIKGQSPVLHLKQGQGTILAHALWTASKENKSNLLTAISKTFQAKKGTMSFLVPSFL